MDNNYFITGVKHCGKSTIGRGLAKLLNIPFFDLDELIEKKVRMSVREFYNKEGPESFLQEEYKALIWLKENQAGYVCATGGGICENTKAFEQIDTLGISILIDEIFEVVFLRISKGGIPPFLKSNDPKEEFLTIYNRRIELYRNAAGIVLNAKQRPPKELIREITDQLKEFGNVR